MRNLMYRATVLVVIGMGVADNVPAAVLDYYRFEDNYADSGSGAHTASVLAGTPAFSGSVPAATIPQTGQSNAVSLRLGSSAALAVALVRALQETIAREHHERRTDYQHGGSLIHL